MEMQLTFCCPSFCSISEPPPTHSQCFSPVLISVILQLSRDSDIIYCYLCVFALFLWSLALTHYCSDLQKECTTTYCFKPQTWLFPYFPGTCTSTYRDVKKWICYSWKEFLVDAFSASSELNREESVYHGLGCSGPEHTLMLGLDDIIFLSVTVVTVSDQVIIIITSCCHFTERHDRLHAGPRPIITCRISRTATCHWEEVVGIGFWE